MSRIWVVSMLAGCSPIARIGLVVDQSGDLPVFSWDVGPIHELEVLFCDQGPCPTECLSGRSLPFGGLVVWQIGYDKDRLLGEAAGSEPAISGPVTYGDVDVPGDERHETATDLEAGEIYGAQADLREPCKDADPNSSCANAIGCAVFTYEG